MEHDQLRLSLDTTGRASIRASRLRSGLWVVGYALLGLLGVGLLLAGAVDGRDGGTVVLVAIFGGLLVLLGGTGVVQMAPGLLGRALVEIRPDGVTVRRKHLAWDEIERVEARPVRTQGGVEQTLVVLVRPRTSRWRLRRDVVLPRGLVVRQRELHRLLHTEHAAARRGGRPRFDSHEAGGPCD